jgi:hypothetical protein
MTQEYFKRDAKQIVDMLFDNKLFVDRLSRDELNGIEELVCFLMQSRFDSHEKAKHLFDSIEKRQQIKE